MRQDLIRCRVVYGLRIVNRQVNALPIIILTSGVANGHGFLLATPLQTIGMWLPPPSSMIKEGYIYAFLTLDANHLRVYSSKIF